MANEETNRDYESIDRPYDHFLNRSDKSVDNTQSIQGGNVNATDSSSETSETSKTSGSIEINGSTEATIKDGGSFNDVWITNFIRSKNWKPKKTGFNIDGQQGTAEFTNVYISGHIEALTGTIGGFTITATDLYGGIIKTAATVGAGSTGVIMDTDGLRGYDSVLGNTFNLPTDGSAPTFASGVINYTKFNVNTSAAIRTSETVGDGTASSAGILINNTGLYACQASQTLANANVKILIDGSASFSGTITAASGTIGGFSIGNDYLTDVGNSFGLSSEVTAGDDVRFWAGATEANKATAPFRVTESGIVTATGANTIEISSGTTFETAARFAELPAPTGSGKRDFGNYGLQITTGSTATSHESTRWYGSPTVIGHRAIMSISLYVTALNAGSDAFFGIGAVTVSGTGHTFTNRHLGFRVMSGSLYASQADGTTATISSELASLSVGDTIELIAKINGTTSVDYYVRRNNGNLSSPVTLSTNMPTLATDILQMSVSNKGIAATTTYQLYNASFKR